MRTVIRAPEPHWPDELRHNRISFEKESGAIANLALGADRRFFDFRYMDVRDADDRTLFAEILAACGSYRPFLVDPPYDDQAVRWMLLEEDVESQQATQAPATQTVQHTNHRLRLLDHVA